MTQTHFIFIDCSVAPSNVYTTTTLALGCLAIQALTKPLKLLDLGASNPPWLINMYTVCGSPFLPPTPSLQINLETLYSSANLLDQTLDFGGIGPRSLVLFGHGRSHTFSFGMTASSAIPQLASDWEESWAHSHFFLQRTPAHQRNTTQTVRFVQP
jgi:hypothetical protein